MARNKAYDIVQFEAGMNDHADARDIEENEVALLNNLLVTNKGVIQAGYANSALATGSYPVLTPTSSTGVNIVTKNLWSYKNDFNISLNESASEWLLVSEGNKLYRLQYVSSSWEWTEILSLGLSTPSHSTKPTIVIYDGNIRYSDGMHILDANSPYLPLTKTKFYGQVRRKYFNATTNTVSTISGDTSVLKPTDGKINFNKDVEVVANRPTQGYLGLEIDKVEHSSIDTKSFGTASAPTDPTVIGSYGSFVKEAESHYAAKEGENNAVINTTTVANSVMTDIFANQSYTESQIRASNTHAQFELGSSSNHFKIGGSQGSASAWCTFFVTANESLASASWGSTKRTIRLYGYFRQFDSEEVSFETTSWSSLDSGNVKIYPVASDGTVGSQLTVSHTDSSSLHYNLTFDDTSKAPKYKVELKASAEEQIDLQSVHLYHTIAPVTVDSSSSKHATLKIQGTEQANGSWFKFGSFFNTTVQESDKLIVIKWAIANGSINYSPTKIFIDFATDANYDNYRRYEIGPDYISKNAGKGWVDLVIKLDEVANIVGTATIGDLDYFRITGFKENYSATTEHEIYIDSIKQTNDNRGTWDGYYQFYYSWVYDRNQESSFYQFANQGDGISLITNQLEAKVLIKELNNGGFGARGKRITGANIYFAEYDEVNDIPKYTDPFLLLECDFEKGVRKANSQIMNVWSAGATASDHYTHSKIKFNDPSLVSTFSINSGYEYDPLNSIEEIRFRTATSLNRRLYYGNVDILWEKFSGETNYKRNKYQDRVYKSLSNKPDIIPSYNYLDIDINDGDEITALASYADRLLVFKKNMMYLVNATQQMEYLEDKYVHKGVTSDQGIAETDIGIAWANSNGAYHYDGEKVIELIKGKIKQSTFQAQVGTNPTVLYEPKERHLLIYSKGSTTGFICDLNTNAWSKSSYGVSGSSDDATNLVLFQDMPVVASIAADDSNKYTFYKYEISRASNGTFVMDFKTKDFPLNEIGAKADIKSIYLTYKGTMGTGNNPVVKVRYFPNKSSSAVDLTNGVLANSASGHTTIRLTPNPKTSGRSLNTIQLQVYSVGSSDLAYRDFELHDISIVYREKSLK